MLAMQLRCLFRADAAQMAARRTDKLLSRQTTASTTCNYTYIHNVRQVRAIWRLYRLSFRLRSLRRRSPQSGSERFVL